MRAKSVRIREELNFFELFGGLYKGKRGDWKRSDNSKLFLILAGWAFREEFADKSAKKRY